MIRTVWRIALAVWVLLQLSQTAAAQSAARSAPTTAPSGLVVVIVDRPGRPLDLRSLDNPNIRGVALQIHWSDLEPADNEPQWTNLDRLFAVAQSKEKWVQLLIFPGFFSPAWAQNGARTQLFPIQYGPGKGTIEALPLPWDQIYLNRWFAFLKLLAARYAGNPAFKVMAVDGPTSVSAESTLPNSPSDVRTWLRNGYTPAKYIGAWRAAYQEVAADFPNQFASLSLGFGLNINDSGMRDTSENARTKQAIVDAGIGTLGNRFVLQYSNLDGNPDEGRGPRGTAFVRIYAGRVVTGFQLRTSCEVNSADMGAPGGPPLALRRAVNKALSLNSAGRHVDYLEVYAPDVLANDMQPVLSYGASGFAAIKPAR